MQSEWPLLLTTLAPDVQCSRSGVAAAASDNRQLTGGEGECRCDTSRRSWVETWHSSHSCFVLLGSTANVCPWLLLQLQLRALLPLLMQMIMIAAYDPGDWLLLPLKSSGDSPFPLHSSGQSVPVGHRFPTFLRRHARRSGSNSYQRRGSSLSCPQETGRDLSVLPRRGRQTLRLLMRGSVLQLVSDGMRQMSSKSGC